MNERLLEILMELFALVAADGGLQPQEVAVVENYLDQQLTIESGKPFLQHFKQYAARPGTESVEALCEQLNQELTATQKYYILIRLLELIQADDFISEMEHDAFYRAAEAFRVPETDYQPLYDFITTARPRQLFHRNLLVISASKGSLRGKHRLEPNLIGYLAVMHIEEADLYILRYIGNGEAYLNGQPLVPGVVHVLSSGSVIRAPRIEPIYYADVIDHFLTASYEQTLRLEAKNVSYRFPSGHIGLHSVTLNETSGRLVAIMGGSGSGKSTLLNVLNGTYKPSEGRVLINDVDLHAQRKKLRGVIGYVAQDDLLLEDLTVYENLYYNAKLCFGTTPKAKLHARVIETLQSLGLEEIKDLKVGSPLNKKISGGQRKRLNIALELIREPGILYVDEPTSGLSSRDSENVMDLLKELSLRGKLVFVVIHQPSSDIYKLFNRLLLLDLGGYPIYYGNPLEAIRYFRTQMGFVDEDLVECHTCGNVNAEQIFSIVETRLVDESGQLTQQRRISPQRWFERFRERQEAESTPPLPAEELGKPSSALRVPHPIWQLGIYFRRDWLTKRRNRAYLLINLLEAPLLAALLAFILRYRSAAEGSYTLYDNSNLPAYLLTGIIVALFVGLTVSAEEILRDRRIRQRERFLSLSWGSYLWAKVVLLMLVTAVQTLLFTLVGNAILGIEGQLLPYWVMLFSLGVFANLLGLLISAAFRSAVTIYILIPVLLIPQLILSGSLVPFSRLNPDLRTGEAPPVVGQLMASRWAYEGLAVHQYIGNRYEGPLYTADRTLSNVRYKLDFWLPALEARVAFVRNHQGNPADEPAVQDALKLLGRELQRELAGYKGDYGIVPTLLRGKPTPALLRDTEALLERLKGAYRTRARAARDRRDAVLRTLPAPDSLQAKHHNEALARAVLARNEAGQIRETNGRLVRMAEPIYQAPEPAVFSFAAPFFVPEKYAFGRVISTFRFNLGVLWAMSIGLFLVLRFHLVRRVGRLGRWLRYRLRPAHT